MGSARRIADVRRFRHIGFVLLLTLPAAAVAQPQSQAEMNEAASNLLKAASAELSSAVKQYRERLSGIQLAMFDQSQQAWVQYRRALCDFESSGASGGSAQAMLQESCLENFTRERLKYIQRLSECEEGDLSCPALAKK
jgi:uncharacterized protein YecT (DUF1311 family)